MLDLQSWGVPKEQRAKREEPYEKMPDGIYYFMPFEDVNYTFSIVHSGEWRTPLKLWTHDIISNGEYKGNVPCLGTGCHMHAANNLYDNSLGVGQKPINKERPFPVKCKIIFPIIVDGIDLLLWYKMGQNTFEIMLNYIVVGKKICVRKRGQRINTTYLFSSSAEDVDDSKFSKIDLPSCSNDYFINAHKSSLTNENKNTNFDYELQSTLLAGKKLSQLTDQELQSTYNVMKQFENPEHKKLEEEILKREIPF